MHFAGIVTKKERLLNATHIWHSFENSAHDQPFKELGECSRVNNTKMHTERGTWHTCTSDSLIVRMNNESTKNTAPSKNAEQAHIHTYW
eukprot:scaffold8941_cov84-Cylindrotheca_fusiformis.AAC.1